MGVSTNAILAFGFNLGEEWPESLRTNEEGEEHDFDAWISKQGGLCDDWEQDSYWKKKEALVSQFPVDLITHCSYEYPEYFLAIRGTEQTAHRGFPEKVKFPEISPSAHQALRKFCEDHAIEWQEPAWHIFSLWGC